MRLRQHRQAAIYQNFLNFLANDKRFTGITVIGHSEGALIGMLACRNQPKVKAD